MLPSDIAFLRQENEKKPTKEPIHLISEYAENKRILPPNTPFPGFWENSRTPYSVEIMDNMSPFNPTTHTIVMKAAQLGLTGAAENVVAYWMDECPATILYVSATERLLMRWSTKRLEPLIDSCGFRHKIFAQTENKGSRQTGDKIFSKEFMAGSLDMSSSQSPSGLRSDSIRILIRDEIDGAPVLLTTGEGNWLNVSAARTNAFGNRKKILDISTPTTFEASLINIQYESGDQRKFFVPCPFCGEFQELLFGNESTIYGIKAEHDKNGNFVKAVYVCRFCEKSLENYHKREMLSKGEWRPTRVIDSTVRSYQLSSLYSPPGMLSWSDLWREYEKAQKDPDGISSFVNLYLGLPFKDAGSRPSLKKIIELRGTHRQGTVLDGVLYLTMGIDVQRGSDTDKNHPARLEMEILGIGAGYRTYSILYKVVAGAIDDPFEGAWEKLNEWAEETKLIFKRKDGREFQVVLVFIDSGDGMYTDVVYKFCSRWANTYPSKGFAMIKRKGNEKIDLFSARDFRRYRPAKLADGFLYEVSTNYYKTAVYRNLKIERKEIGPQRPGFCDFPIDYGEKYFKMLSAEEKRRDKSFYCPSGRRNEALDCRVLALCAADVFLDAKVADVKAKAKEQGATVHDIQLITTRMVIDRMEEAIK